MRDWNNFFTAGELILMQHERFSSDQGLADVLNAKIREALEAAPKVYSGPSYRGQWIDCETMHTETTAHIIDMKPIEKGD